MAQSDGGGEGDDFGSESIPAGGKRKMNEDNEFSSPGWESGGDDQAARCVDGVGWKLEDR